MITLPDRSGTSSTLNVAFGAMFSRIIARTDPMAYEFQEALGRIQCGTRRLGIVCLLLGDMIIAYEPYVLTNYLL